MKTILITGTTSGIGKATVELIAKEYGPVRLILANRDKDKTEIIISALRAQFPLSDFQGERLDLSDLTSVRETAERINLQSYMIDTVVLNAGLQVTDGLKKTCDGFEMTFGVNHLGHFLLARKLLGKLSLGGRIIVVSSGTHDPALNTGIPAPRYSSALQLSRGELLKTARDLSSQDYGKCLYSTSKLCNLMFGYELAKRLRSSQNKKLSSLQVGIFDPKMTPGTGLARTYSGPIRWIWNFVLPLFANRLPGARSVGKTAKILAWLSMSEHMIGNGLYFDSMEPRKSSIESYDQTKWIDLWSTSCELCGLSDELTFP